MTGSEGTDAALCHAFKDKPYHERRFHEDTKTWKHAPRLVLEAIAKTKNLVQVVHTTNGPSCYMPGEHAIIMCHGVPSPANKRCVLVWRHEFAHAIDGNGNETLESTKYIGSMLHDSGEMVVTTDIEKRIVGTYVESWHGMGKDDPEYGYHEGCQLAAFVCALTKCRHGHGFSPEYLVSDSIRIAEMFACYVTLISGSDGEKYQEVLHKMAPASCAAFDLILQD